MSLIRESKREYKGVAIGMRRRGQVGTSFQEIYYAAFDNGYEVCAGYASAHGITHMATLLKYIKGRIDKHKADT